MKTQAIHLNGTTRFCFSSNQLHARADLSSMTDDLHAAIDAALAEPVHVIEHAVAGFTMELVYDGFCIVSTTWHCGSWWCDAEVGDA